jgi:hypothetical protein
VPLTFNGDDELRDDGEHFSTTLLEHIEDTLNGEETIWVLLLTDTLEENGQVVVVVKLLNLNFPIYSILRAVLNSNGKVTTVVESAELACRDGAIVKGTSSWLLGRRLVLGLEEADCAATNTLTLLNGG